MKVWVYADSKALNKDLLSALHKTSKFKRIKSH